VAINTTRGPLADARVRQALNHAVDTPTILDQLLAGRGRLAAGVIPPSLAAPTRPRALRVRPGRPSSCSPPPATRTASTSSCGSSQDATIARLAQSVQGYLNAAGIRAKLVQRDASSVREAARNGQADLFVKTGTPTTRTPTRSSTRCSHSQSKGVGGNYSFYANPRVDSLVDLARRTQDDAARARCRARPTRWRSPTRRWCTSSTTTSCTPCSRGSAASRCRRSSTASAGRT
jgi:peptide/nickel transport system substrate-binding protein